MDIIDINDRLLYDQDAGLYFILAIPDTNVNKISCHDCIIWKNSNLGKYCDIQDPNNGHLIPICTYYDRHSSYLINKDDYRVCIHSFEDQCRLSLVMISYIKCKR